MKSLVTIRTGSAGPIGVAGPEMPSGVFHIPSITGVIPVQWYCTLSPEICGNRPVPPANPGWQNGDYYGTGRAPEIVERLPNGRTANTSPHVISPGCSPALGGAKSRS